MPGLKKCLIPLALASVLAGCGSTVSSGQSGLAGAAQGADLNGLANPATSGLSTPTAALGSASTDAAGQLPGAASSNQGTSAMATDTNGQPPRRVGAKLSDVLIGYPTSRDLSAVASNVGIAGADTGDLDAQASILAADINSRGGLLGHRIVLVNHDISTAQATSDPAAAAQAACTDWVQDHHVFAVADTAEGLGASPGLRDCLTKAKVPLISNGGFSDADYASSPLFASPSSMTLDRYLPAVVDRLVAQGFFGKWDAIQGKSGTAPVKIGAQSFDNEQGRHYIAVLRKALARHGLTLDQVESHSSDVSANAASTSSAVLRFKAQGVTHIFNANLLFYKDSDSQSYHPRYAIDDTVPTPQLLAKNVGKSQLHGAMGVGYQPLAEVEGAPDIGPAATRCFWLMRKGGQSTSAQFTRTVMANVCDNFFLLEAAFKSSGVLTPTGMITGVSRLGTAFKSAFTYQPGFSTNKHYGANRVRDFVYSDVCGCFTYPSTTTYQV